MAKELPYFKFYTSEWLDGDITIETLETQGLFINICALYWSKEGDIYLDKIKKRFRFAQESCFSALIDEQMIKVDEDDKITISFLDEQLEERENLSKTNSLNGKKGGRPKKRNESEIKATENRKKPTALNSLSEIKANKSNIEERREEERREEKRIKEEIIEESIIISSKDEIESDLKKQYIFLFDEFWKKYDKKVDREKCLKKWMKLKQSEIQQIFENIEKYVESTPDKQFRKNPLTYLNSKSYENEIITKSIGGNYNGKPTVFERHLAKFEEYQQFVKENNPFAFPRD